MFKLYFLLKKARFRKKVRIYQQLFILSFDWTILFYTIAFVAYIAAALILEGGVTTFHFETIEVENFTAAYFFFIMTSFTVYRLFNSFRHPGVLFSSAEYTLQMLPNSLLTIWLFTVIERWLKSVIMFGTSGLFLFLFSSLELKYILLYTGLFIFLQIVMTIPEWKFFSAVISQKAHSVFSCTFLKRTAHCHSFSSVGSSFYGSAFSVESLTASEVV